MVLAVILGNSANLPNECANPEFWQCWGTLTAGRDPDAPTGGADFDDCNDCSDNDSSYRAMNASRCLMGVLGGVDS